MKPFRIIQISDLHGNRSFIDSIAPEIEAADLVALSGDLTNFGGKRRAAEIVEGVLGLNPRVVAIPGNCDRAGVNEYLEESAVSVDGIVRRINGFHICGVGGSLPCPVMTPQEYSEEHFAGRFGKLLAECGSPCIAIVHQPPIDSSLDRVTSGAHVGSRAVRDFLERSGAVICLTGHIHESDGIDTIGATKTVNPGPARHGRYAVIDIENGSISVEPKALGI